MMARSRSLKKTRAQAAAQQLTIPFVVPMPPRPARGLKLKTVSRLMMLFALGCLAAFWAGRAPVAATPQPARNDIRASASQQKPDIPMISMRVRQGIRQRYSRKSPKSGSVRFTE